MEDIALDAGFRNADHFYKVFPGVEGVAPGTFRDRFLKNHRRRVQRAKIMARFLPTLKVLRKFSGLERFRF